jgi:hypothetical protein
MSDKKPELDRMELIFFCERCFASSDNSSWGEPILENHCCNCGAGGPSLKIPRYSVEMIRSSAFFVGSRYYPSEEAIEMFEERKRLRGLVKEFPGRTAEPPHEEGAHWSVKQEKPGKLWVSTMAMAATTAEEALHETRLSLPYYDEESLNAEHPEKS